MEKLLARLGRTQGTLKERTAALERDLAYPESDEGRAAIMADIERILRDAEKRSALLFAQTPKAPVIAKPYPPFRWASAAASYNMPAPDGSRPGTFQIPLRLSYLTRYGLRTLVYHETVPGHHFQIALEMENVALPRFRQIRAFGGISALSEGWGLYAERLAAEVVIPEPGPCLKCAILNLFFLNAVLYSSRYETFRAFHAGALGTRSEYHLSQSRYGRCASTLRLGGAAEVA